MKKKLNETAITNELKGGSLFFTADATKDKEKTPRSPKSSAKPRTPERTNERTSERVNTRTSEHPNERTSERANERTPERTNARAAAAKPAERLIVRYSFQFYRDQIARLKQLQAQKMLRGEECHLSDLARQALDEFLQRYDDDTNE